MAFGDDYPTYQFILAGEICFSEKEGRLIYLPIERSDFGGKRSIACVPRGEKWETTIYMQRFVEQPEVGNYHVSYTVKLPYWWQYKNAVGTEMTDDGGYVTGGGSLSFSVTPSTRDQLSKIAKNYESQLSSDDYRQARIAEEALCVMSDSVVVPYLVRLAYWCRSWHLTSEALARFANDENARPVVVGYLSSKDPHAVMGALLVLAKWNIKLTEEEIRKVLKVNGHQINEAIENYVHRIEGRADSNMR